MKFGAVVGSDGAVAAAEAGFDYVEIPLAREVNPLFPSGARSESKRLLTDAGIPVEAGCVFYPMELKVVGPDVDRGAVSEYIEGTLENSAELGIQIAVFGSGGSRNIPEGFPQDEAEAQIDEVLTIMGDQAQSRGITVVIEPLNSDECNFINSVEDAHRIAAQLDHPGVQVLADMYHISVENEGFHGVLAAGSDVAHIHVSNADRSPPTEDGADWIGLFRALTALGYDSRMSLECRWSDFAAEAPPALKFLKKAWGESF